DAAVGGYMCRLSCVASRSCFRKMRAMPDHNTAPVANVGAPLIDIGINLVHDSYDADREQVLARAQRAGGVQLIVTGSTLASSTRAIEPARAQPGTLYATAGVHPHHAAELGSAEESQLRELASDAAVVAVGECGLDYYRNFSPPAAQQAAFHRQ